MDTGSARWPCARATTGPANAATHSTARRFRDRASRCAARWRASSPTAALETVPAAAQPRSAALPARAQRRAKPLAAGRVLRARPPARGARVRPPAHAVHAVCSPPRPAACAARPCASFPRAPPPAVSPHARSPRARARAPRACTGPAQTRRRQTRASRRTGTGPGCRAVAVGFSSHAVSPGHGADRRNRGRALQRPPHASPARRAD